MSEPMLQVPRALLEALFNADSVEQHTNIDRELRALLATPVVERQEPIGIEGMPQYLILFDDTERPVETMFGEEIARKRYSDISISWNAHLFVKIDSNSRDAMFAKNNATVVTSPPAPTAPTLPHYTCIGKGGDYERIGYAKPSGALRTIQGESGIIVYRDIATGQLYFRDPADFLQRMSPIDAAK